MRPIFSSSSRSVTMPITMPLTCWPAIRVSLSPALLEFFAATLEVRGVAAVADGVRRRGDEVAPAETLAHAVYLDDAACAQVRQSDGRAVALEHLLGDAF